MHYIFAYGLIKKGCRNNIILKDSEFICTCATKDQYALCIVDKKPYVIKQSISSIKGELYKVSDETLSLIDKIKGHPRITQRELVKVQLPDTTEVDAWLYFYIQPMKNSRIEPSGYYTPNS